MEKGEENTNSVRANLQEAVEELDSAEYGD